MKNESTLLSLSNPQTSDYWIRIEQPDTEDEPTLEETVEILDALYDIDTCGEDEDSTASEDPPTFEEFASIVASSTTLTPCKFTYDFDYIANLLIIRSDLTKTYKLVLTNGSIDSTEIINEFKELRLVVEEAESVALEYPVTGRSYFAWDSEVIVKNGGAPPVIRLVGDSLEWDGEVTGTIVAGFDTVYESLNVVVFNEDGGLGECTAIAFYEETAESHEIEVPNIIEEYLEYNSSFCSFTLVVNEEPAKQPWPVTKTNYYCQCSGELHYSEEATPWDDLSGCHSGESISDCRQRIRSEYSGLEVTTEVNGGYVNCGETTGDINDPVFYEETCCEPPPFPLPRCSTYYRENPGGESFPDDEKQSYIEEYGEENVTFTAVSPEDGDCGYTKYTQVKISKNCCEGVSPIEWDYDANPEILIAGSNITVYITGGIAPYTFKTTSTGTSFAGGKTIVTSNPYAVLYADSDFCGQTAVQVSDGCSTVSELIRSNVGAWNLVDILSHKDILESVFYGQTPDSYSVGPYYGTCYGNGNTGKRWVECIRGAWKFHEIHVPWRGDWHGGPALGGYGRRRIIYNGNCEPEQPSYLEVCKGTADQRNDTCFKEGHPGRDPEIDCMNYFIDDIDPKISGSFPYFEKRSTYLVPQDVYSNPYVNPPEITAIDSEGHHSAYKWRTAYSVSINGCGAYCHAWGSSGGFTWYFFGACEPIGKLWKWGC